jgi:hypothetical protein
LYEEEIELRVPELHLTSSFQFSNMYEP